VAQATEIYSREFDEIFLKLPQSIQNRLSSKIHDLGSRLATYPHQRLQGRSEFKLRAGDYRIIYLYHLEQNEISLVTVGHRSRIYSV
jgi:mRNA-degrading endonuclease RelE of RelBE toxin-antitoxin system